MPRTRIALGALALGGAFGTSAWGQTPSGEGVVKLGGGAATVSPAQGIVGLSDPSASMAVAPGMMGQAPMAYPPQQYATPYNPYQSVPRVADRNLQHFDQGQGVGYAATQDVTQVLYRVQHTQGEIYGANNGYTSLNAFVPLGTAGADALWYVQPRANVTNDGRGMANLGVGYRLYTPDDNRVWSASFWWDGDGGHHAWYNQLGAHFASVGKFLTWRGGFALPIGSTTDRYGARVGSTYFIDDNVGLNIVSQQETAYRRYDLEASTPLPYFGRYGWEAGVGAYYLEAREAEDSLGVSARVEAQITEDFWINTLVTSDEIFGGNLSVNMELTLPNGAPSRWLRPKRVRDALTESDKRNYRVAAAVQSVTTQTLAIDPNDGLPLRIAHIDPNQVAPGNGFVQSPFMSILEFETLADGLQSDYDIVLVQSRNDNTDTNLNTGVTLFDNQRLLGAALRADGTRHSISAILNGVAGQFELPYTPATIAPLLTNSGNPGVDVVTLANLNEVSAFRIDGGQTAAGIRGTGIDGFNLNSLAIATQNVGIDINSDTSAVLGVPGEDYGRITNVTVTGAAPATAGIRVVHQAGDLDLLVANNTVTGVVGETVDTNLNTIIDPGVGISIVAENTGVISATSQGDPLRPTGIFNNTATGSDTNLQVTALNGGEFTVNVISNTLGNNTDITSAGFVALADNGELTLSTVAQNTFNNNVGDGVRMEAANGGHLIVPGSETDVDTNGNGIFDGGFVTNTITGNGRSGVRVVADGPGSVADVSIGLGNNISNNAEDAIVLEANDGGVINVDQLSIANATGNGGAILRVAGDGGTIDLGTISGTTFDRRVSGSAGILFDATNATISGIISGNQFLGSSANADTSFGIGGEIRGGTLDLVIDNNLFDGNADAAIGLIFAASDDRPAPGTGTPLEGDAVEAKVVITRNTIINTFDAIDPRFAGQGIALILNGQEQNNGVPPLDPTTNIQPAAHLEGLIAENIIGVNPATADINDPDSYNVADGNDGAGIYVEVNGDTSITDLAGIGSAVDDIELTGLFIGATTYQGEAYQGNLIANNDEGVVVRRNDSSVIDDFVINGNNILNNLNDGIDIAANNGGLPFGPEEILNFEITDNLLLNNGFLTDGTQGTAGRGIQLRAEASSLLEVNIRENAISGNRLSGIEARTFTDTHDFIGGGRDTATSVNGGDNGAITGVWELNTITNNGFLLNEDTNRNGILDPGEDANNDGTLDVVTEGHGIALGRIDFIDPDNPGGVLEGFNNGGFLIDTDGDGVAELPILSILNNTVAGNAEDGIHVYLDKSAVPSTVAGEQRTTRISILGNDIVANGEDGFNLQNTQGSSAIARVEFSDNLVAQNGLYSGLFQIQQAAGNTVNVIGDGVEIVTAAGAQTILEANNNRVIDNNGRGVNILTAEGSHLETFWDGNNVSGNSREGFYVVNAHLDMTVLGTSGLAAGTPFSGYTTDSWLADFDSNHEMYTYGHLGGTNLGAAGNTVPAIIAPFFIDWVFDVPGAGPVTEMRLTNNIINNNGGVVPDADGEDPYSTLGGLVVRVGTAGIEDPSLVSAPNWDFGIGGVIAEIDSNQISGNVGRDVYMDGFVSTQSPATGSFGDPLIRIDLQFRNNRGGSIDVGAENFAVFYNNTNVGIPGATNVDRPNPPFTNQAVLRDATRNIGDPLLGELPFPGFGSSTLRIELDGSAPDAFGNNIGNNLFNLIYSDFNFFDWQSVPVGTLPDPTLPAIFP